MSRPHVRFARSRAGWAFVVLYLVIAAVLFGRASTCTGWVCDLVALPAVAPVGFLVGGVLDGLDQIFVFPGYSSSGLLRNPWFIVPTVLGNAALYYGIGTLAGRLASWAAARVSRQGDEMG
jgi:hypothetical protein